MKPHSKKRFQYDTIIDEENICNLEREQELLFRGVENHEKLLVYGRRNTGKTSLVKNVVAAKWLDKNPGAFHLYVDFYGVRTMSQLLARINSSFVEAFKRTFRTKAIFTQMLDIIKSLRPQVGFSSDGTPTFSIALDHPESSANLHCIFEQINKLAISAIPVLVVFDEFQDIGRIDESEGILRDCLQNLSSDIPVIIMGSKKHLLSKIFAVPAAPFFNWGNAVEFGVISYEKYTKYMNERFENEEMSISQDNSVYLQNLMHRNPEQINRLCDRLLNTDMRHKEIEKDNINQALEDLVDSRHSVTEEYLANFNASEEKVLTEFAKLGGEVRHPMGKDFLRRANLSLGGVKKAITKMENESILYKEENIYLLADPLLKYHILKYRP